MGAKVGPSTSLQWSQPISCSHSSNPFFSPTSLTIPNHRKVCNLSTAHVSNLRFQSVICSRSSSFRACWARFSDFSDEEISQKIEELCLESDIFRIKEEENRLRKTTTVAFADEFRPPRFDFSANLERKVNRVGIPFSLRIIRKRQQQQLEEGFEELGDLPCCAMKKAFSSMVLMIRELQICSLEMRELLFYEDLQEIMASVQRDMNASFVWLFQKVFSGSPTLMVYVMILLADFTVHSMDLNTAIAASCITNMALTDSQALQFDSESVKMLPVKSSPGFMRKTLSEGIDNGKGGKKGEVSSVAEGGGTFRNLGATSPVVQSPNKAGREHQISECVREQELSKEEEDQVWSLMVEEAWRMHAGPMATVLDRDTLRRFVAPVSVELEAEDFSDYHKTELFYQMGISKDPNNSLLLCNYAQFLSLVVHDHDRAEECFKRAVLIDSGNADALSKYADFLWITRKDLWGAEEQFQQALAAEPGNPCISSKYATFLWSTGGEETCYLLSNVDTASTV